ncbi:DUF2490 domain-containing protein [Flavobacterium amnicola]|uniref:DUF2490 domain-containing protein n=1 Tax=Flavobacterium amnicola TaxID=2506422 RepID=A0A4Q1K284_9FLAO|nr:DUF2490 domain-containing protein [Flavobacterium amnicola]RXR19035.1 DUF2490 domain-containing protein [Flavobacterium amnicola]
MKKIFPILALFLGLSAEISAQQKEHLSGFTTLSLTYKFNPNWYVYAETQARSIADFSEVDYYEIKGGAGYNFNKSHQAFVGLGRYASYTDNKLAKQEFRVWIQYVYSKFISRVKLEQRVRAEKRFFNNPGADFNINTERYRYRMNVIIPLNKEKIEAKTFFTSTYNEIFFAGDDKPTFSRNRLFGGLGYQATNSFGVILGYLWQRDFGLTKNTNTHFIFCGLNFTLAHKEHKSTSTIVTPDAD